MIQLSLSFILIGHITAEQQTLQFRWTDLYRIRYTRHIYLPMLGVHLESSAPSPFARWWTPAQARKLFNESFERLNR